MSNSRKWWTFEHKIQRILLKEKEITRQLIKQCNKQEMPVFGKYDNDASE